MKKFELPQIKVDAFSVENIVTTSQASVSAQNLSTQMKAANPNLQSVKVVKWDTLTSE